MQSLEKDIDREIVEIQNNGIMAGEYMYFNRREDLKPLIKKEQTKTSTVDKNDIKIFYK